MKKLVAVFAVVLLLSCSKDDDSNLPITFDNIRGKWNFKSVIKTDGTVVPFVGFCPTLTDWLEIFPADGFRTYNYYPNCVDTYNFGSYYFTIDSSNRIYTFGGIFVNSSVTKLTTTNMTIEYDEPEDLNYYGQNITDAKAIILERRQN